MQEQKIKQALTQHLVDRIYFGYRLDIYDAQKFANDLYAAIAPHLSTKEDDWSDAPEWAQWRTVDKDGTIIYWDMKPYRSDSEENWQHQNARVNFKEIIYSHSNWENSLQRRP